MKENGRILDLAKDIINGERQNQYGDAEDSFSDIAVRWSWYLSKKLGININLSRYDAGMMLVEMKLAREIHQHKKDNLVDACGYLGLVSDMIEDKKPNQWILNEITGTYNEK